MRWLILLFVILLLGCNESQVVEEVEVTDFESCVKAGNSVMESYPRQCSTKEGKIYVEDIDMPPRADEEEEICVDMCGDGECQSLVCMGSGCPCAENKNNCPEDCS